MDEYFIDNIKQIIEKFVEKKNLKSSIVQRRIIAYYDNHFQTIIGWFFSFLKIYYNERRARDQ
jgi:hypothetical protein